MLKRVLHSLITSYLAILLLFGTTSKEFIHVFTHHEDTVHPSHYDDGQAHMDGAHHHCSFLSFTLEPFANDCQFTFHPRPVAVSYPVQQSALLVSFSGTTTAVHYLRGPPVPVCA